MLTRCVTHVRLLHCQVTKLPESGGGSGPQEKQNFGVGILFFQVRRTVAIVFRAQSAQITACRVRAMHNQALRSCRVPQTTLSVRLSCSCRKPRCMLKPNSVHNAAWPLSVRAAAVRPPHHL